MVSLGVEFDHVILDSRIATDAASALLARKILWLW
jgi:hypothetical protein